MRPSISSSLISIPRFRSINCSSVGVTIPSWSLSSKSNAVRRSVLEKKKVYLILSSFVCGKFAANSNSEKIVVRKLIERIIALRIVGVGRLVLFLGQFFFDIGETSLQLIKGISSPPFAYFAPSLCKGSISTGNLLKFMQDLTWSMNCLSLLACCHRVEFHNAQRLWQSDISFQ